MSSYTKVFTQLYDMIIWYGMVRYDNNMIWDMGLGCLTWKTSLSSSETFIALDRYRNSYHVLNDRTVISRLYPRA
jgi:hypothetical protein